MKALLIGREPPLGYEFVMQDYEAVVVGALSISQALGAYPEQMLSALAGGMPVILYEPGFPKAEKNRALGASLASRRRELKSWGVQFVSGGEKKLITAQEARQLKDEGRRPAPRGGAHAVGKRNLGQFMISPLATGFLAPARKSAKNRYREALS